jgi:hypothetical protein
MRMIDSSESLNVPIMIREVGRLHPVLDIASAVFLGVSLSQDNEKRMLESCDVRTDVVLYTIVSTQARGR